MRGTSPWISRIDRRSRAAVTRGGLPRGAALEDFSAMRAAYHNSWSTFL
jgi:hypothetical protein